MEEHHYDFSREEEEGLYYYSFRTQLGAFYWVNFSPDRYDHYAADYPNLLDCGYALEVFSRNINSDKKLVSDKRVQPTVCRIIADFLSEFGDDVVLIYHCDTEDGKQAIRSRKFRRWFNEHPLRVSLILEEIAFEVPRNELFEATDTYYAGFLCKSTHPQLEGVKADFERFMMAPFRK